ncbi:MAG UNVERIFIED_CONTAM: hypothetical protein LVR18_07800 [Planctomycetaceae bacterium]|jgi:hypothetical protein
MSDIFSNELPVFVGGRVSEAAEQLDRALRTDFCPWANRWVYWMKEPFWCVVLAAGLSLAVGLLINPVALLLTAVLVLLGGLAAILPWFTMRGLDCVVSVDQSRGRVGESLGVRLRIRNRRFWPAWGVSLNGGFPTSQIDVATDPKASTGVALARIPWANGSRICMANDSDISRQLSAGDFLNWKQRFRSASFVPAARCGWKVER